MRQADTIYVPEWKDNKKMNTGLVRCLDLILTYRSTGARRTQGHNQQNPDSGKLYRRNYQFLCQINQKDQKQGVGNGGNHILKENQLQNVELIWTN